MESWGGSFLYIRLGILLLFLGLYWYFFVHRAGKRQTERLKNYLASAQFILDVRSEAEYKMVHYPGAINVPLDKLFRQKKKLPDPLVCILVYCASGSRARQAIKTLKSMGYKNLLFGGSLSKLLLLKKR